MPPKITLRTIPDTDNLRLCPVTIDDEYRKEWNIYSDDFVCFVRNKQLLRSTLYRIGGIGFYGLGKTKYFTLLKYVEAYYSKDILDLSGSNKPKYLADHWVILDSYGNEKVESKSFETIWVIENSCIYLISEDYYNIETGKYYGKFSGRRLISSQYVFLKGWNSKNILRIDKLDGTTKIYP